MFHEDDLSRLDGQNRQFVSAIAFDRLPLKLPVVDCRAEVLDSDWVVSERYSIMSHRLKLGGTPYRLVAGNRYLSLFTRLEPPSRRALGSVPEAAVDNFFQILKIS